MERAREREKVRKGVTNPPKYRIIADYRIIAKIPHHCGLSVRDMSRFARFARDMSRVLRDMSREKRDRDRIQMRM
jgi:hypothetical protein